MLSVDSLSCWAFATGYKTELWKNGIAKKNKIIEYHL